MYAHPAEQIAIDSWLASKPPAPFHRFDRLHHAAIDIVLGHRASV
jgi:hypothetical protein